jgi:hypothetical protein|tara:strand:- start:1344 stop:1556 length:213 start_codon:yes stop_codon:yes gene_type:complete
MKIVTKPVRDLDYVVLYANEMYKDNSLFDQQKELVESQLNSSSLLFRRKFGKGVSFKKKARDFLSKIGLI